MGNNVLGDLFQDIAEAIRYQTGGTETMKPMEFPDKIYEIVASGGDSSGGGSLELSVATGTFTPTEKVMTVEHGMGIVPDIIAVFSDAAPVSMTVNSAFGFSTACKEAFGEECKGFAKVALGTGQIATMLVTQGFDDSSLPSSSGCVRAVTADTFTMGSTTFGLDTATSYTWYAYGGITTSTGGGGSIKGVHFVTFIGADGTVLYKRPVADGDDCADVYARGLINKPTKKSTVESDFAYSGWSLTQGGSASSSALKSVTGNRTVYAAFTASARKYTARFLDGDTVMSTQQVAYGSKATPPNTDKDGHAFIGWTPEDLTVYGNTDFVGTWVERPELEYASWEAIAARGADGTAKTYWKVGDTKTVTVNVPSEGAITLTMEIVGFDCDVDENGNTIPISFISKEAFCNQPFHPESSPITYDESSLCAWYSTLVEGLPADLQSVLKVTQKTSYGGLSYPYKTTGYYKCWCPSQSEFSSAYKSLDGHQVYPRYKAVGNDGRKKALYNSPTTYVDYWIRGCASQTGYYGFIIDTSGAFSDKSFGNYSKYYAYAVLGFCV